MSSLRSQPRGRVVKVCGGRWGSGFYLDEEKSLTLEKMVHRSGYRTIVLTIRDQAARVLGAAEKALRE